MAYRSKLAHFKTISEVDLPQGRKGKHHEFLTHVLDDLQQLPAGRAIKIPCKKFANSTIADLRSAINRATTQRGIAVATSSDDQFLYVWKPAPERQS